MNAPIPLEDRLWPKIDFSGPCWLWTASLSWGYGQIRNAEGGSSRVHRIVWELLVGPIPEGMTIDHLCRVRSCCNPDHLEVVTQRENNRRAYNPTTVNLLKTHCIHGHELTGYNLYIRKDRPGRRDCRECSRTLKRTGGKVGRPAKTECIRGHEFTPENTYINPKGGRSCRACAVAYREARRLQSAK